ncbi:efflux RND transporter periplasmic adaptor subunit [Pseudanabaenaceae cyanobacterium LEGE 13415]|nr:efflux RND transporter periplasmic adaptor subunit [Pseudanabaenaceae cyanobacterium LEGE 13415]
MTQDIPHEITSDSEPPKRKFSNRRIGLALLGVLLLGTAGFFGLRSQSSKPDAERNTRSQITPVTVATATQKTVPVQISAIGHVQADSTVSVIPQATGRIIGVFFHKGQDVHKGQLLFTLDDRSQTASIQQAQGTVAKDQAQVQQARATMTKDQGQIEQARATLAKDQGLVRQAEATLAKDQAQAQLAQSQSDRYNNLYKQGAISQDQAQQYSTNRQAAAATLQSDREAIANAEAVVRSDEVAIQNAETVVKGDQAGIENAQAVVSADGGALNNTEVQASYTKIYSPIDGRAGDVLVTEGNVVQANGNNPLVVIEKVRPIQVSFAVPESNLPELQKHMDHGKLKVDVTFTGSNRPIAGSLSFVNNTVDTSTGTIQLMGEFDNSQGQLFPGQFVNTTLTLSQEPNATVVPAQAVQNGPNGQFVFVVKPDSTVENVPVVASSTIDSLDVIQKGVQPGVQVVTDGQANLVTGSQIRIKDSSAPQATSDQPKRHRKQSTTGDAP